MGIQREAILNQKPYLHLGAGRINLPGPRPAHHGLIPEAIYSYPLFWNVDRNAEPGIDEVVDLFKYPWPWETSSFDGAVACHLLEHLPHEIRLADNPFPADDRHEFAEWIIDNNDTSSGTENFQDEVKAVQRYRWKKARAIELANCQDGWFAFFAELYRVLTPGALVYILSPYGWSQGAITDPSHTRLLTEQTFTHSMQPDPNSPFRYETGGIHFEMENVVFGLTPMFQHLAGHPEMLQNALQTQINVVYDFAVTLRVVK